jgi:MFS family permease
MPLLARPSYARELNTTFFFAIALAMVEGSVISVFVKQVFSGHTPESRLNFMVALVGSAPEMANILSFLWVAWSHGRPKVKFINALQLSTIGLVALIAFAPRNQFGLIALTSAVILARICWSGIITLRPTVWRQNYPRSHRARIVGKFSTLQVIVVALAGLLYGTLTDLNPENFRWFVPLACVIGLGAVFIYKHTRVRGQPAMLKLEQASTTHKPRALMGPIDVIRVLKTDRFFARFQLWLFVLGIGNLMLNPILVIVLKDQFKFDAAASALIVTTIPLICMPIAIPLWARLLDRAHVVKFRSIHGWTFVASTFVIMLAMLLHTPQLLYLGAVLQGFAYGGGTLAWNMGHHDFAPANQTSQYMAAHLTLNGIRGILGPLAAVALYQWLHAQSLDAASILFALIFITTLAGAAGFVHLRLSMGKLSDFSRRPG